MTTMSWPSTCTPSQVSPMCMFEGGRATPIAKSVAMFVPATGGASDVATGGASSSGSAPPVTGGQALAASPPAEIRPRPSAAPEDGGAQLPEPAPAGGDPANAEQPAAQPAAAAGSETAAAAVLHNADAVAGSETVSNRATANNAGT